MRGALLLMLSIAGTVLCWGAYGPTLHEGKLHMSGSNLRPFICVGMAYFLIAVLVPGIILYTVGERGRWTFTGAVRSTLAGALAAIGALGILLAFAFRGSPLFVMPLVFGGAPVVNTFVSMHMSRTYRQAGPIFYAGLILVIVGAITVLMFKPASSRVMVQEEKSGSITVIEKRVVDGKDETVKYPAESLETLKSQNPHAHKLYLQHRPLDLRDNLLVTAFALLTAICWGSYAPILHKGQAAMDGSRLRPFMCVGLAYFLIAVLVPLAILSAWNEPGEFTFAGTIWSLVGGAVGALGALGIIMSFTFGGRPIYVMPLVFGGAPIVNTFISITKEGAYTAVGPVFIAGIIITIAGAVTVLVFAPKGDPQPKRREEPVTEAATT